MRRPKPPPLPSNVAVLRVVASTDDEQLGRAYRLDGQTKYVFGRSRDADHRVRDPRMSRLHAQIAPIRGQYEVEDLASMNGTFVDGRRVDGAQVLDGQVISMGDTLLVVDRPPARDLMPSSPDADGDSIRPIYGLSLTTQALRASVATVAPLSATVLLLGPTGVGKEVTARAVHEASGRSGEFVAVNCAAIPHALAESEFFGYSRGAFSGAERDHGGFFQRSSGGTLFLDELGELGPSLQAKLLRVIETQEVQPLGPGPAVPVDLRIVAATNADLARGQGSAQFRTDLLARLNQWEIHIPPLVERKADILELWRIFLQAQERPARSASAEFCEALLLHDWPQNARELRNLAHRIDGVVGDAAEFQLKDLPVGFQEPLLPRFEESGEPNYDPIAGARSVSKPAISRPQAAVDATAPPQNGGSAAGRGVPSREEVESALRATKGNIKLTAEQNKWHRTQLYRYMRRYGIDPSKYR
ncbi:MAG: sigma 54-interacting transcriptional regulator [Myxococcota bacterium]